MTEIITLVLAAIGELAKIAVEAAQNAKTAEAELLVKLRTTLTTAGINVDARLVVLEAARKAADEKIEAAAPAEVLPVVVLPVGTP